MVTLAQFRQVLAWGALAVLTLWLYRIMSPFLSPLAWAGALAIFFHGFHKRVHAKLTGRNRSALVSTALVTLIMVVPTILVLQAVVGQAVATVSNLDTLEALTRLQRIIGQLPESVQRMLAGEQLGRLLEQGSAWARQNLAAESARVAGNLARFFFELGVMVFALFYFFRDGHMLMGWFSDLNLVAEERRKRLMHDVANDVRVSITSTLVVAWLQGFLGGLMFWALGLSNPLLWGVVMGMVSLVPVLGPWLVYLPAAAWLIMNGQPGKGLLLAIVGLVIVSSADNLLRPFLIAGRSPLNAFWVFLSVLGGLQAFGLLGVVAGPVLVGAAQGFLRALRDDAKSQAEELQESAAAPLGKPGDAPEGKLPIAPPVDAAPPPP